MCKALYFRPDLFKKPYVSDLIFLKTSPFLRLSVAFGSAEAFISTPMTKHVTLWLNCINNSQVHHKNKSLSSMFSLLMCYRL